MNAGYLTSAINAPSRNATAHRYVVSKVNNTSSQDREGSVSESSKNLVPSNYGSSKAVVETVPMDESSEWRRQTQGRDGNEGDHIHVTREYVVSYENKSSG